MSKVFFANCKQCGKVELDNNFTDQDGAFIVPVVYAPNISTYCKLYKKVTGSKFEENTYEKPSDVVTRGNLQLSHVDIDSSYEAMKAHQFTKKIECWTDV